MPSVAFNKRFQLVLRKMNLCKCGCCVEQNGQLCPIVKDRIPPEYRVVTKIKKKT
jgi:hypothetical protein